MWINSQTADYLFKNTMLKELIPEKVKEQFWADGFTNRFLGLTLVAYDQGYVDSNGDDQYFIAPKEVFIFNRACARRLRGPVVNAHAPANIFGRYGRNWIPDDGRSVHLMAEWTGMPALTYPNSIIYVDDVTSVA
jgi:hypothetical protein